LNDHDCSYTCLDCNEDILSSRKQEHSEWEEKKKSAQQRSTRIKELEDELKEMKDAYGTEASFCQAHNVEKDKKANVRRPRRKIEVDVISPDSPSFSTGRILGCSQNSAVSRMAYAYALLEGVEVDVELEVIYRGQQLRMDQTVGQVRMRDGDDVIIQHKRRRV